jgi:hypothetical protein
VHPAARDFGLRNWALTLLFSFVFRPRIRQFESCVERELTVAAAFAVATEISPAQELMASTPDRTPVGA